MSIKSELQNYGITTEDLDDLVHIEAEKMASGINNSGMTEQIAFLTENRQLTLEDIVNDIEENNEED